MSLEVCIRKALGSFRLEVDFATEGETLALLGASGSGKSVTLRCVAGILRPDEGRIVLNGQVLFDSAAKIDLPPQRRGVGYLFQNYALFPHKTVAENIAMAAGEKSRRRTEVAEQLHRFQLEEVANLLPAQLSGGQQQRTALARILASRPKALLLDEPFSALDSYLKWQLEQELAETLARFPGPILWVSHDRGEVYRNCPRVCVMEAGKSQPALTREELLCAPGTQSAARLSGCKNFMEVRPANDCVEIPHWGLSLACGRSVPPETCSIGLRAHHLHPAQPGVENAMDCTVERVVEDVFELILMLRPLGAGADAPLLRMETKKTAAGPRPGERLRVAIDPADILLLR